MPTQYTTTWDPDGDGYGSETDCHTENTDIHPGADDPFGDGIDQDCDWCDGGAQEGAGDGIDRDCDGFPANDDLPPDLAGLLDCNDTDATVFPGAEDIPGDGIDQDCDGHDCEDQDADGYCEGESDCDDNDPDIHWEHAEIPDGKDNDCNGVADDGTDARDDDGDGYCEGYDLYGNGPDCTGGTIPGDCDDSDASLNLDDLDGDGFDTCDEDCDDDDDLTYPAATEQCDGLDNDCDGVLPEDEWDADQDGWMSCEGDCDDQDDALNLDDADADGYDTCDSDCDDDDPSMNPGDADGDGHTTCGGDCDDGNAAISPDATEVCDFVDNDCDGVQPADEVDLDGDGDPACSDCDDGDSSLESLDQDSDGHTTCDGDCDDSSDLVHPLAEDYVGDDLDINCDGLDGVDSDSDGYAAEWSGGEDCEDTDAALNLDDADLDGYSTCDGDCDDTSASLNLDDADADGWTTCAGDCNDALASTFPGAMQTCDGVLDDDCDGVSDDHEVDDDGDGMTECDGDCDDAEPATYAGAPEDCDGVPDNDCNGELDPLELDDDLDGHTECEGDCDDVEPRIHPGAAEICDGFSDNDCDGVHDADDLDGDGDGFSSCSGDCDDTDLWFSPHAAELCDGWDNDCDGAWDEECVHCDIEVPADHASIQDAIDAAVSGDEICVFPGTYLENIDLIGKELHLVGIAGPAQTVIDGKGVDSVMRIQSGEGPDTLVEGFTLTNGYATEGGGVYLVGSNAELRRLSVVGNIAEEYGGGLYLDGSTASFEDVNISDNQAYQFGGGLRIDASTVVGLDLLLQSNVAGYSEIGLAIAGYGGGAQVSGGSVVMLEHAVIEDNEACCNGGEGGGLDVTVSTVSLQNAVVIGNDCGSRGGGVNVSSYSDVWIHNTLFLDNAADRDGEACGDSGGSYGGGLSVLIDSSVHMTNSVFARNWSTCDGGAISLSGYTTPITLENVTIVGNEVLGRGGGIYFPSVPLADLNNVTLSDNFATEGGGAYANHEYPPTLSHCNAWNNSPNNYEGIDDPTGVDGNVLADPGFLSTGHPLPEYWDLHLSLPSDLVDAGDPTLLDPDGSPSDIGAFGGEGASGWDLDHDGYPGWWQPGPYDPTTYPDLGLDCDDRNPLLTPMNGC